jgi:hypothetical protein
MNKTTLALLLSCAACANTQRPGYGSLILSPLYNPSATNSVYLGADGSHFFAMNGDAAGIDFDLAPAPDGCAYGTVSGVETTVCPTDESRKTWRATGPMGNQTYSVSRSGDNIYVDLGFNRGRASFVVPTGLLTAHPELVGAAFSYGAFGIPRAGSYNQAYAITTRY